MTKPAAPATASARRPRRRWVRPLILWGALLIALAAGLLTFLTQGPGVRWAVRSVVESATGCTATFGNARLRWDGSLVVHDLVLHAPDIPGPGGDILRADRVLVFLDWSRWRSGQFTPTSIIVHGPVVRISQDDQGRVNFATLRGARPIDSGPAATAGEPAKLPFVRAIDGTIELGEHTASAFVLLARLPVEGSVTPLGESSGAYAVSLHEVPVEGAPSESAVRINGVIDVAKGVGDATLEGLDLRKWTPDAVPLALRREWRALGLDGVIAGATVHFDAQSGLQGEITFKDIAVSLPAPTDAPDAQPARVRMHGVSGSIRIWQHGRVSASNAVGNIEATLAGTIEDLPCRVNLRVAGLDPDTATIDCEVISDGFAMKKSSALRAFAPDLVLMRLEQFSGPTAVVDARVKVRRDQGLWTSRGSVIIKDGSAAFAQFPYPFRNIAGKVEFDEDSVRILGITGVGLTGAKMVAHGKIWPPADGDFVEIDIDVREAPIDEVLAAAIDENRDLARAALWIDDPKRLADLAALIAAPPDPAHVPIEGPPHAVPRRTHPDAFEFLLGREQAAALRQNSQTWRGGLYQALFSDAEYAALDAAGLILNPRAIPGLRVEARRLDAILADDTLRPDDRAAFQDARDEIARRLDAPPFTFGGMIDRLVVAVRRNPGTAGHYDTNIHIEFDPDKGGAGMVPEPFPLPILARALDLEVREDSVAFRGEGFTGLRGGVASVSGSVDMTDLPRSARVPAMTIIADELPVDDLLIAAIPERLATGNPDAPGRLDLDDEGLLAASAPEILSALGLSGNVSTLAKITQLPDGSPGYDVTVALAGLTARPRSATFGPADAREVLDAPASPAGLLLADLHGALHVTQDLLEVTDLRGTIGPSDIASGSGTGVPPVRPVESHTTVRRGAFTARAASVFADAAQRRPASLAAHVEATGVDLAWPIEDLAAAFSRAAASRLLELRRDHHPAGAVDASVRIEPADPARASSAGLRVLVGVTRADDVAFDFMGGRLDARLQSGDARVRIEPARAGDSADRIFLRFQNAHAITRFDGQPAGEILLDGVLGVHPADAPDQPERLRPVGDLRVAVTAGAMHSGLTRAIVASAVSPALGRWFSRHDLAGAFDADLLVSPIPAAPPDAPSWTVVGTIDPRDFAVTRRGVRTTGRLDSGRLNINGRAIALEGFRAVTPAWNAWFEGSFLLDEHAPRWTLDIALGGDGTALEPTLLSLLPQTVSDAAAATTLSVAGTWSMPTGRLVLSGPTDAAPAAPIDPRAAPDADAETITAASFQGELNFSDLAAEVGVSIAKAAGKVVVDARLPDGALSPDVRLDITAPSLLAAGVPLTEAGAVIVSGRAPGEVLAPTITGRCAGGSLSGMAWVRPPEGAADPDTAPREFGARVELGGVRLAELLDGIDHARLGADLPAAHQNGNGPATADSPRRGFLTAQFSVGGIVNHPASRRGRGTLTIDGGDVLGVPLMAPLLELSNIIPPMGDRLNYMQALFYLDGPAIVFEDLRLQSGTVEVVGSGSMSTPDLALDLVFNSRGRARVPIWSDLFEGLRNEIITTTVKGTLRDPKFDNESLRGTRSIFSGLFDRPRPTPATKPAPSTPPVAAAPTGE